MHLCVLSISWNLFTYLFMCFDFCLSLSKRLSIMCDYIFLLRYALKLCGVNRGTVGS